MKKNNEAKKCLFFFANKIGNVLKFNTKLFFFVKFNIYQFSFFCMSISHLGGYFFVKQAICFLLLYNYSFFFFSYLFLHYNNAVLEEKTLNFRLNLCIKLFRFECKCRIRLKKWTLCYAPKTKSDFSHSFFSSSFFLTFIQRNWQGEKQNRKEKVENKTKFYCYGIFICWTKILANIIMLFLITSAITFPFLSFNLLTISYLSVYRQFFTRSVTDIFMWICIFVHTYQCSIVSVLWMLVAVVVVSFSSSFEQKGWEYSFFSHKCQCFFRGSVSLLNNFTTEQSLNEVYNCDHSSVWLTYQLN